LDYEDVKWTVAGKINTAKEVQAILDAGVDFVTIGRAAILHHDFPKLVMANPDFETYRDASNRSSFSERGLKSKFFDLHEKLGWFCKIGKLKRSR